MLNYERISQMLHNPTAGKLRALHLHGMAQALEEQNQHDLYDPMTFDERLGLLVDREATERSANLLAIRLRKAKMRQDAAYEDIDFRLARGLDRSQVLTLCQGEWIKRHQNCLVTGPTGAGKSFVACALANKACRDGHGVLYARVPRLFSELALAKADGSYGRKLIAMAKTELLVLDDWGLAPMTGEHSRDFLEILDDRYDRRSTLVVSQLPVDQWHQVMPEPTIADAALDRLVHNAHRIGMTGESVRKRRADLTEQSQPEA
jgi:DNA replication protein DnaC